MSPLSERESLVVQTKGVQEMPRGKKFTAEQIIGKLREAEVGLAQGKTLSEVVRKPGVTEQGCRPRDGSVARWHARGGRYRGQPAGMKSPGHRKEILTKHYKEMGIGVACAPDGKDTFWCVMFGDPTGE
jgi:hypothetical protein